MQTKVYLLIKVYTEWLTLCFYLLDINNIHQNIYKKNRIYSYNILGYFWPKEIELSGKYRDIFQIPIFYFNAYLL